ncbi:hypothetical protein AB0467_28590 [Streptomyces sp. NPDC052095]|uniref:hypothetical protein n=1 Tax=unclassified Streptomyces TaxID=2593676 RepID=UPI003450370B
MTAKFLSRVIAPIGISAILAAGILPAATAHADPSSERVSEKQCQEGGGHVRWQSTGEGDTFRVTCEGGTHNGQGVDLFARD